MILNNNCPFDVYVRQGIAAEPGSRKGQGEDCGDWSGKDTPEVKIGKGDKYVTPVPVIKNTCGHSGKVDVWGMMMISTNGSVVKVARKPAEWQTCYRYEFNWAQENGKIWYVTLLSSISSLLFHHIRFSASCSTTHRFCPIPFPTLTYYSYLQPCRYNLSSLNGNPFTDVARQIGGPYGSTCPYLRCQPGNDGRQCDWPLIKNCPTVGDIIGYLC
jgi:hypothetical protein